MASSFQTEQLKAFFQAKREVAAKLFSKSDRGVFKFFPRPESQPLVADEKLSNAPTDMFYLNGLFSEKKLLTQHGHSNWVKRAEKIYDLLFL